MLEYLIDGGPMMVPLLLCSIVAISVIIDRIRAFRRADVDNVLLREEVNDCLERGRVDDAIAACGRRRGPVAAVLLAGLQKLRTLSRRGRNTAEIELAVKTSMEDYAPRVLGVLEKRMNLLTLIGSVSPILGMTGTVTGMIRSFNVMAAAGGLQATAVAGGISEALITTAAGLIIALPAIVAYNLFAKKVDAFAEQMDESVTGLIDFISLWSDEDRQAQALPAGVEE
jgi:biopolymer transport protein ExbB